MSSTAPVESGAAATAHLVRGRANPAHPLLAAAVIGPEGGTLRLGSHRLVVPQRAVSAPTRFRMRRMDDGWVKVELEATSVGHGSSPNDVGRRGFAMPVVLSLSYGDAATEQDPERLLVVWVKRDGTLERMPSVADPESRYVNASLGHFSAYALATD